MKRLSIWELLKVVIGSRAHLVLMLKDILRKDLETGISLHRGAIWETEGWFVNGGL
jgi:hypothetical protein